MKIFQARAAPRPLALDNCTVAAFAAGVALALPNGRTLLLTTDDLSRLAQAIQDAEAEADNCCPACGAALWHYGAQAVCPDCVTYAPTNRKPA